MRRLNITVVLMLFLIILPAVSIVGSSQEDAIPFWDSAWSYREELHLPILTNNSESHFQSIDLQITFDKLCWTENENQTSIRICCWYLEQWYELESQIYNIIKSNGETTYITECNIIFLIPSFADGTERYFIYYNDYETPKPLYTDHLNIVDSNYSSFISPELSAKAKFYGIKEDGICVYGVGQEGKILDRSCAQVIVKQKKNTKDFDVFKSDQIVSLAFSYYYGSLEKDESSSDQVFIDKKIFIDGNLMVQFGIISESKKKDIRTTVIYSYYYNPLDDKRLNVHVKHEMLKDAVVQGIDNIDGRFGSLISLKARSAIKDSFNFGEIYPFLDFYGENNKIEHYQLNQNPATKDREWIVSFKDDASLGEQAWVCYGQGKEGIASGIIFESNKGIISGTDERDGIQLKVAEREYLNFLGTEVDYASINFGRHSFKNGYSHDITIPSDLIVEFDAEIFFADNGGYPAIQKESHIYQKLIRSHKSSGDIQFDREEKRYNLTIIPRLGGIRFTYPWLSHYITANKFPVVWIELHHEGKLIAQGAANRSIFFRAKKTFFNILENEYLVKIFLKYGNTTKIFTGSTIVHLEKNTKVPVFCTWERQISFTFLDQYGRGIPGIYAGLTNKDGILYDDNITKQNGELTVKAPFNIKDSYKLRAEYKDFIVYNEELKQTIKKLDEKVNIELYDLSVIVTDALDFPPGIELTPILVIAKDNRTIQLTPNEEETRLFSFKDVLAGDYNLQIIYGDFIDEIHVTVPGENEIIQMKFSAIFDLTIDVLDSKGVALTDSNIDLVISRDNQTIIRTKERTLSLPPAQYTINVYIKDDLIGIKQVALINNKHLTVVTTIESLFPVFLSWLLYVLFGFFMVLTLLKKFSLSSLLKCLAVFFIIISFFQPWWLLTGSNTTIPAEKTTALYINPAAMIETIRYYGEISLNIAEIPNIFIMFLGTLLPLSGLACFCLIFGIIMKKIKKKNYAFLLCIIGVTLLCFILSSFYVGTTKLTETSIGAVQGEAALPTTIRSQEIMMHCNWGFSYGFYLILIAIIITSLSLILDVRNRLMQNSKLLSQQS